MLCSMCCLVYWEESWIEPAFRYTGAAGVRVATAISLSLSLNFCIGLCILYFVLGFPGGADVKASACNVGDLGLIPGSGRSPGGGNGNPLQYSCHGESHGGRSLVGYSSRGRKESNTTELLHFHYSQLTKHWEFQ